MREIKVLQELKHPNIVNLMKVFREDGKIYLVFEHMERTVLNEIEDNPDGLHPYHVSDLLMVGLIFNVLIVLRNSLPS